MYSNVFNIFSLPLKPFDPFVNGMDHPGSVQGDVPDDWGAVLQHHRVVLLDLLVDVSGFSGDPPWLVCRCDLK